jgi:hypothetical protein
MTAFPMIFVPKARAHWAKKTLVHPNVDNLRVVCITDPNMTTNVEKIPQIWREQEKLVNKKVVWENMDKMACGLIETHNPEDAWRTLFIKPPMKSWSDTVVAIKTNCIHAQHTHSAVMAKICHTLTDIIGVAPYNIHIYDARHGHTMSTTPFQGLPENTKVENTWGGIKTSTSVPPPMEGETSQLHGKPGVQNHRYPHQYYHV